MIDFSRLESPKSDRLWAEVEIKSKDEWEFTLCPVEGRRHMDGSRFRSDLSVFVKHVNGKELGKVPRLAICKDRSCKEVFLFHCDDDWDVLGCSGYASVNAAKAGAEHIYHGIAALWTEAHVTEEEAEHFLHDICGDERCSVCGRRGDQVEELTEKGDAWICDDCLAKREESGSE